MAASIRDVMGREIANLRPSEGCEAALQYLLALNIEAAPVIDDERRPLGMLALADLLGDLTRYTVAQRMSSPAATIAEDASLALAEAHMAETGFHHLAVIDGGGRLIGFLSAIDLLRAHTGKPVVHPSLRPLYDPLRRLGWSEPQTFSHAALAQLPAGPGHLVLLADADVVMTENCHDLRARAHDLLEHPTERMLWYHEGGPLSFRCATLSPGQHRVLGARG